MAVCYYHSDNPANTFFDSTLENNNVKVVKFQLHSLVSKFTKIRIWLKSFSPDIVQAYMLGPSAIAVLSGMGQRKWKVVVSERIIHDYQKKGNLQLKAITQLFRFADWITTNSHSNLNALLEYMPSLKRKSSVIWNCVDLEKFNQSASKKTTQAFHFSCIATMCERKNVLNLVRALDILRKKCKKPFEFEWIGSLNEKSEADKATLRKTRQLVNNFGLHDVFNYSGESRNVEGDLKRADAFVLVSQNEGLPNVICEGMASGLPVIGSKVADIPLMIAVKTNGFLCDHQDVNSIAAALQNCLELNEDQLAKFGQTSREMAEKMFSRTRFIDNYEELYYRLLDHKTHQGN